MELIRCYNEDSSSTYCLTSCSALIIKITFDLILKFYCDTNIQSLCVQGVVWDHRKSLIHD